MIQLQNTPPDVYGNHVVRRTEKPIVGISSDLTIEQVRTHEIYQEQWRAN